MLDYLQKSFDSRLRSSLNKSKGLSLLEMAAAYGEAK